jgi:membrane-associated phospholipid phosphatase
MNSITRYTGFELDIILILDYLGLYAPLIQFFSSLFFLRNKFVYLRVYLLGFVFNNVLNSLLKMAIKEPRPTKDNRILEIAITNNVERIGFHKFGMPSGHAQNCGFNLVYLTMVLNDSLITGVYLILSLISVYQRYKYFNHSVLQLIVGFVIGLCIGYIFYVIGNTYITGNIKQRPDDNAPK